MARTYDYNKNPVFPFYLYYGTRLHVRMTKGSLIRVKIKNLPVFYLKKNNLQSITSSKSTDVLVGRIVKEAYRFLGVPYLWGGITPMGFDCSGFVRAVFGRFEIYLPRDTRDQIKIGTRVDPDETRKGDLLFFKRHVALARDRFSFIHASAGGSGVGINSLDPARSDYRFDLAKQYQQTRRIIQCN